MRRRITEDAAVKKQAASVGGQIGQPSAPRNAIKVGLRYEGDTPDEAMAWELSRPEVKAAATIQAFQGDVMEVNALAKQLSMQVATVNSGSMGRPEAILISQAHTLDDLFNYLARRSQRNMGGYLQAAETYLRLALKAQGQCRATLETLAAVKNPPVVFAKQANFANGPQQVNNGAPAQAAERQIPETKKLEQVDGEWMDTRAPGAAVGANPQLASVGEDQGTRHSGRKGESLP